MNRRVFISGSISVKTLPNAVQNSINKIVENQFEILVGDAHGVDTFVQQYCSNKNYFDVKVYSISNPPRYLASNEFSVYKTEVPQEIKKERERQQFKDRAMTDDSDYCLVIWDGKSNGSYSNIVRALDHDKQVKVYFTQKKNFLKSEEITQNNIDFIFRENNGYTASEVVNLLKSNAIEYFQRVQDLNKYLLQKTIIKKEGSVYIPIPEYANLFIEKKYKGKTTGIRFRNEFISWIEERIKKVLSVKHEQLEMSFQD